jgi:outer membrane immunogenic protein
MTQVRLMTAAAALALLSAPALSHAQDVTGYGTLGVTHNQSGADNTAIQGRLGARFGQYVGVEGELSGGVDGDNSVGTKTKLRHQEAIYGVGFYPVTPNIDVLARVGYGESHFRTRTGAVTNSPDVNSWNYGVGAQYSFDDKNGIRVDYTKQNFEHTSQDADTYGVAYVRKF